MRVLATIAEIRNLLDLARADGSEVGLVPTMGFLHDGHLSLMRASVAANDLTVTSIFVNPLQFGEGEDLEAYPRDLERDYDLCSRQGVDLVFAPDVGEMYAQTPLTKVTVGGVSEGMEGAARPTHFAGVATVVAKLFHIAGPCRAYFGEKDWQQLTVVRRMVADLSIPAEVVGCPIVREPDGLAMSSRNVYLETDERLAAVALFRALSEGVAVAEAGETDPARVEAVIREVVAAESLISPPDYVAVVAADTLQPVEALEGHVRLLVAAQVGRARLLDNMGVWV